MGRTSAGRTSLPNRLLLLGSATVPVFAAAIAFSAPAAAQDSRCAARDALLQSLTEEFGKTPVNVGVTSTGALLEVLAGPDGAWTILVTLPGGPTCMVSSGEGWRDAPLQVALDRPA